MKMSSNDILRLIHQTSQVEFKLVFPVRIEDEKDRLKEKWYPMNVFSRFFEFGYIDKRITSEGIIQNREYYVAFNTILGEMFVNNLKSHNIDCLPNSLYHLPPTAQLLYRKFLIHHNFTTMPLNLHTIAEGLNLKDVNPTNLERTVEDSGLEPLKTNELILSYEKVSNGFHGTKYIIKKPRKKKEDSVDESNNELPDVEEQGRVRKETGQGS